VIGVVEGQVHRQGWGAGAAGSKSF
jgi:hypothetical protein